MTDGLAARPSPWLLHLLPTEGNVPWGLRDLGITRLGDYATWTFEMQSNMCETREPKEWIMARWLVVLSFAVAQCPALGASPASPGDPARLGEAIVTLKSAEQLNQRQAPDPQPHIQEPAIQEPAIQGRRSKSRRSKSRRSKSRRNRPAWRTRAIPAGEWSQRLTGRVNVRPRAESGSIPTA
jgi:hypothetical protein